MSTPFLGDRPCNFAHVCYNLFRGLTSRGGSFLFFSAEYVWSEEAQISPQKTNLRKIVRKAKQNVSSGVRKGSYKTCNFSRSDSKKRRGLLPDNGFPWFNLNQPCTRTGFGVRRRSVKGSNHGLLCLVILVLLFEAANQGVQPRPLIPCYTGF